MINYGKLKFNLKNILVHGIINLRYIACGRTMAEIEILDFGDYFAGQARIKSHETEYSGVSSGKTYATAEEAANDVIALIEKQLIEDEFVRNCQNIRSGNKIKGEI